MLALLLLVCVSPARGAEAENGQLFKAPGATLYYEVRGPDRGTPLVVVNGGPGYDHTYLHRSTAWDELARSRRIVFYDQRGNGRSPALAADQTCTLRDQVADLEALRQHLGSERIDLLGHSWGGYLVMAYAARHPQHVAHLVICDSAAPKFADTVFLFKDVYPETTAREEERAFAEKMGDATPHETSQREYFSMLFYSPEKRDAFIAAGSTPFNRKVNQAIVADLENHDLNPELGKFRFPTLVLTGRFDMNVAPAVAWKIHRAIPGSRFVVFERSGHLPFYEEPAEFIRTLQDFLAAPWPASVRAPGPAERGRFLGVSLSEETGSMSPKPQSFLVDAEGNRVGVVLDIHEYQTLLEDLEELESVRAYDAAKASGEQPIPFEQAIADIERHRK